MPFTKNGFSDTTLSSPLRAPTTEISFYSPVREPFKWSHKKFNRHQQRATCSAPCQQVPRPLRAAAEPVKTQGPSLTLRPHEGSPGKEEKKKKRRESDAKWRSNLSCCFNHLKNKVLPTRSCQKTRVSKEVIVQKTVERVEYLESVVMLLNQAIQSGKNESVSPTKGQQNLQMARKEFTYKYHFKRNKDYEDSDLETTVTPKPSKKTSSKPKKVAVKKPGKSPGRAVVSARQRKCDQLVPSSGKAKATMATGMNNKKEKGQTVPSVPHVTTSSAQCPEPTRSLICNEQDLSDKGNHTPLQSPVTPSKLTPRKVSIPLNLGIYSQSPHLLTPIKPYPSSPAWSPIIGAIWSLSQEDPNSPYSRPFTSTLVGTPSKRYQIVGGTIKSLDQGEQRGWDTSSQDLDSCLDGRDGDGKVTPDLMCEEEIPPAQEEERSQKSNTYLTPRSSRAVASSSKPPGIPPKKRASNWSARFINDMRLSQEGELLQSKSNRCKRLIFEGGEEERMTREPPEKKPKVLKETRKKYHKRSTAARIRPWDPQDGKVLSPLYGVSRKFTQKSPKRCQSPPSGPSRQPRRTTKAPSQPSKAPNPPSKIIPSNKAPTQQLPAAQNQGSFWTPTTTPRGESVDLILGVDKPNLATRDQPRGLVTRDTQTRPDPDEEGFLDVESVINPVRRLRDSTSMTTPDAATFQGAPTSTDPDTESSQGSLLLQEIPHLPDDIIAPLLLYGETSDCFLQDKDVEETLQRSQPTPVNLNLSKSDDEIVLTILELEEESCSSSSTSRSSPECSGNNTFKVLEVMSPNPDVYQLQEFLQQEAFLEGLQLSGDETGSPSRRTSVIISPVKVSSLSVYKSPEKASYFLLSPVKSKPDDEALPKGDVCYRGRLDEGEGLTITESFARFASSALRNHSTVPLGRYQLPETDVESTDRTSDGEKVYSKGATQALLNGQVVSKTKVHPMFSLTRPQRTLICIDSGTPTKNPSTLEYSMPLVDRNPEGSAGVYPTSDTAATTASHISSPSYMSPLSTITPSTPSASPSLGHLSQDTLDASYSQEMPNDHYSMSQQTSSIGSKDLDEWDFADHPPIQLEAEEESLDSLMDDEFLGGYYNSYRDVRNREVDGYREGDDGGVGAMEVPIWIESTNVASQSSETSSSCYLATNNSSDTISTADSLQGENQVVPSIMCNEADSTMEPMGTTGNRSEFEARGLQYVSGGSPDKALQIFQQWLINN
ncbi:uncharacterized protein LOC117305245 isoform X1 [Asterias rubens]|uniref:uncharacterized protein LOC117305245 isoform X1 n=1 Tax=Asterias rubens TaxID=7604 RepID=UPI0014556AD9|nr:uncharacterized protein LOC117305245 isoform X1 [Asterias rubens]